MLTKVTLLTCGIEFYLHVQSIVNA